MRLLAITPPSGIAAQIDPALVGAWIDAGVLELGGLSLASAACPEPPPSRGGLAVLLREPGADAAAILAQERLLPLRAALARRGIPALVSVDPRTCDSDATRELIARADPPLAGIQLRGDPSAAIGARYRAALGAHVLIACSVHGRPPPNLSPSGSGDPFDYACLAPIFAPHTALPGDAKQAIGLDALRAWATARPNIIALGGITPEHAAACLQAGAHGVAGIRLFFGPVAEARQDVEALCRVMSGATDDHVQA